MPRYRYADVWPRIFSGLSYGVNATVTRQDPAAGADAPGSTVELMPGDEVETSQPVESAFLTELAPPAPPAPAPAPAPSPTSAPTPAPAPEAPAGS